MAALKPAYMSVTYGATGGTSDYTVELASEVEKHQIPALAHLTCASSTKEKVASVIEELKEKQISNILALRGDIPQNADFPLPNQYRHGGERRSRQSSSREISASAAPAIRKDMWRAILRRKTSVI